LRVKRKVAQTSKNLIYGVEHLISQGDEKLTLTVNTYLL
jgi:hypothetical protein